MNKPDYFKAKRIDEAMALLLDFQGLVQQQINERETLLPPIQVLAVLSENYRRKLFELMNEFARREIEALENEFEAI
jgi:hypothetical protein